MVGEPVIETGTPAPKAGAIPYSYSPLKTKPAGSFDPAGVESKIIPVGSGTGARVCFDGLRRHIGSDLEMESLYH